MWSYHFFYLPSFAIYILVLQVYYISFFKDVIFCILLCIFLSDSCIRIHHFWDSVYCLYTLFLLTIFCLYFFACVASSILLPTTLLNHSKHKWPILYFLPSWNCEQQKFHHPYHFSNLMILYITVCLTIDKKQIWKICNATTTFITLLEIYFSHHLCTKTTTPEHRTHQAS